MKKIVSFFLFSFALMFGAFALTDNAALNVIATNTGSSPTGSATAANQTATQANPGSDATKATAVQGVTGGKAVAVSAASLPLPSGAATEATLASLNTSLGSSFGATAGNYFDSAGTSIGNIQNSVGMSIGSDTATINSNTAQISTSVQSIDSHVPFFDVGFGAAATGTIRVALALDQPSIPVLPGGNSFSNITTATTTTVKASAGTLHTITVNSLGTVASAITVYNNTSGSGAKIATINSLSVLGTLTYDITFSTGLTIVSTGTVAPDVTVSYR